MFELELVCDTFAADISEKLFAGHLPDNPEAVTAGIVQCVARMIPDAPPEAIAELSNQMLVAFSLRIAAERDASNDARA